jgi:hypothetical protein
MAKSMNTGKLIDPALLESFFESDLNAALRHGIGCAGHVDTAPARSREDELWIAMGHPIPAKDLKCAFGQRNITILGSFAMANMNEHPGAVDIGDSKMGSLLEAKSAGVDGGKTCSVTR